MICECGHKSKRESPVFPWHCACGVVWVNRDEKRGDVERIAHLPCPHLGEPTGEVVVCGGCSSGELPVRKCALHVVTIQRRPVVKAAGKTWDGINCLDCRAKGLDRTKGTA